MELKGRDERYPEESGGVRCQIHDPRCAAQQGFRFPQPIPAGLVPAGSCMQNPIPSGARPCRETLLCRIDRHTPPAGQVLWLLLPAAGCWCLVQCQWLHGHDHRPRPAWYPSSSRHGLALGGQTGWVGAALWEQRMKNLCKTTGQPHITKERQCRAEEHQVEK